MSTPTVTPPIEAPEPYTITTKEDGTMEVALQTGEKFSGKPDDVIKTLAKAKYDTGLAYREVNTKLSDLQRSTESIATALQPKPPAPTEDQIAEERLREYMATQTASYLGFESATQMKEALTGIQEATSRQSQQENLVRFHSQAPEFPGTPEASDKLIETAVKYQLVPTDAQGNILKFPTPGQLMAAHALALRDNVYKPLTPEEQAAARTGQYNAPRPPTAPPMTPGTQPEVVLGTAGNLNERDLWRMKPDELAKLVPVQDFQKLGIRR